MTPALSVVLATRNRVASLRATLATLAAATAPDGGWEVIVVDNGSSDGTAEAVAACAETSPVPVRLVSESRPGKSWAVNAGIQAVRGAIVAFTDDDVHVHPGWPSAIVDALADPAWAGAGGRIVPDVEGALPRWLSLDGADRPMHLGGFDLGAEPARLVAPPFGANMAFRRDVFERYGGFRTDLGPAPGRYLPGQDTEFGHRLLRGGEALRWVPAAVVRHRVRPETMTEQYVTSWYFAYGRMSVRTGRAAVGRRLFGVPSSLLARWGRTVVRWSLCREPRRRFELRAEASRYAGAIVEVVRGPRAQREAL